MLVMFVGCTRPLPPVRTNIHECVVLCVEETTRRYFDKLYSTQDKFFTEIKELCEFKLSSKVCYDYGVSSFSGRHTYGVRD